MTSLGPPQGRTLNLSLPFFRNSVSHPERLALTCGEAELSYGELASRARQAAHWLRALGDPPRVGILASRSVEACAAVLGCCCRGSTYVPLSHKWPPERILQVSELAGLKALIADSAGASLLAGQPHPPHVLAPSSCAFTDWESLSDGPIEPTYVEKSDIAYIIFTSGSTGVIGGRIRGHDARALRLRAG